MGRWAFPPRALGTSVLWRSLTALPSLPIVGEMSAHSLLDLKSLTEEQAERLFALADRLSHEKPSDRAHFENRRGLIAALVFFEPSTRTRLSFEAASAREGLHPMLLDAATGTSLEKGETPEDTVLNIAAMSPSIFIIRCKDDLDLADLSRRTGIPILNGGWGLRGHPTQALLDAYAIRRKRGTCRGQRVLLIGDIRHSRVAASHVELSRILGYEIAFCGPRSLLPEPTEAKVFTDLKSGLEWATVAMALRVQSERHAGVADPWSAAEWQLDSSSLKSLAADASIMHPGPVNWGVELHASIAHDPRCLILDQVAGGVWIRQALIRRTLEGQ